MIAQDCLDRLDSVRPRGISTWSARCPAHQDHWPSLSICEQKDRILIHCFAGCSPEGIVAALGLRMRDLFIDNPVPQGQRPTAGSQLDLTVVAFRIELAALDRRLRAERVLNAVQSFHLDEVSDGELDQLLNAVASAYEDRERAEHLESVADRFRVEAFQRKENRRAA